MFSWQLPRPSEISEKNWSPKAKPFLTSYLWYKAMRKVWTKSLEPFIIYQLLAQPIQSNFTNNGRIGCASQLVDPKGLPGFSSYFQHVFISSTGCQKRLRLCAPIFLTYYFWSRWCNTLTTCQDRRHVVVTDTGWQRG